jgi:hypothetical protein
MFAMSSDDGTFDSSKDINQVPGNVSGRAATLNAYKNDVNGALDDTRDDNSDDDLTVRSDDVTTRSVDVIVNLDEVTVRSEDVTARSIDVTVGDADNYDVVANNMADSEVIEAARTEVTAADADNDVTTETDESFDSDMRGEPTTSSAWDGVPIDELPRVGVSAPAQYPPLEPSR